MDPACATLVRSHIEMLTGCGSGRCQASTPVSAFKSRSRTNTRSWWYLLDDSRTELPCVVASGAVVVAAVAVAGDGEEGAAAAAWVMV